MKRSAWTITGLVGAYIACQLIADIAATKMIALGSLVIPAGTFVFTITFTLRDMVHKKLGRDWARAAIVYAGIFNVLMSLYLAWMAKLPSPDFFGLGEAWASIFMIVPNIVVGSITAEIISELADTEVYHLVKDRFTGPWQFMRVLISNVVSLPIDSFIFGTVAFMLMPALLGGEALPASAVVGIVAGQIVWKAIVTVISLPGIYLIKEE